jgi:hypothetical protein
VANDSHSRGFSANTKERKKNKRKDFERRDYIAKEFSAKCNVDEIINEGWGYR